MTDRFSTSNVYYLPASVEDVDLRAAADLTPRFGKRLRHAWWRLRLALAEIRTILWRPRRRFTADDYGALLEVETQPIERPVRPAVPARVIDFETARVRLRPSPR